MGYERTEEHRRLRAELIKRWKPWEKSSGPKTDSGKARSAKNSYKHGLWENETKKLIIVLSRIFQNKLRRI